MKNQVKSTSILNFCQSKMQTESTKSNINGSNILITSTQTNTETGSINSNILIDSTQDSTAVFSTNSNNNILYINDRTNIANTSFYVPEKSSFPDELSSNSSK